MKSFLLYLCIVASAVHLTEACRCIIGHPQTDFCRSDYVIKARILREKTTSNRKYRVNVLENYKEGGKGNAYVNSRVWIYTALDSCSASFAKGYTYIITGSIGQDGKLWTNLCYWIVEVSDLTSFQKKALERGIYKKNCKCKINESGKGCTAPYENSSCLHDNAACTRSSRTCKWTKNSC